MRSPRSVRRARRVTSFVEAQSGGLVGTGMIYGPTPWADYEAFARAALADRARPAGWQPNGLAGLGFAAAFQGRFSESWKLFAEYDSEIQERGGSVALVSNAQDSGFAAISQASSSAPSRSCAPIGSRWVGLGSAGFGQRRAACLPSSLPSRDETTKRSRSWRRPRR